jgi:hypothetical protein
VGSAAHPWRVDSTGLRDLRTYGVTLSATPEAHCSGKQNRPVAHLSRQPSRGACRLDFFTVPTLWLRTLYCFAIEHGRRRILHRTRLRPAVHTKTVTSSSGITASNKPPSHVLTMRGSRDFCDRRQP